MTKGNYWLKKDKEQLYLKIISWAQRHRKKVETLTKKEILEAVRSK